MDRIRALLVNLVQIMMVVIIVMGTIGGFVVGGSAGGMYSGFSIGLALVGAVVGFCASSVGMSVLAILLDIRQALLRIRSKGAQRWSGPGFAGLELTRVAATFRFTITSHSIATNAQFLGNMGGSG